MNNLTIAVIGALAFTKTIEKLVEEVGCEIVNSLKAVVCSCIHMTNW